MVASHLRSAPMSSSARIEDLIDLQRYPIDAPATARGIAFRRAMRTQLSDKGLCQLPGFITPDAVTQLVKEADAVESQAYFGLTEATPYFTEPDPDYPDDHPVNTRTRRDLGLVASDLMAQNCTLKTLYEWEPLRSFLTSILNKEHL